MDLAQLAKLRGDSLVVAPVSLALLGLVRAVRRWDARRRLRAEADEWILRGYQNRRASRFGWRIDELTGACERRLPGAVPINRIGLRPCRAELGAILHHLEVRS
jgi:hypothetical protein